MNYYVYVYIDPRNYEEFYYGKGKGSRKRAHLSDTSDSEKSRRIKAIRAAGLEPIIRVIARNLTEQEALLVERTLLWKLGKQLTNIASGHFSEKFRPHDKLHLELSGFDFNAGIYYYNVGQGSVRKWSDFVEFGFISAGQGTRWRDAICGFSEGDIFAAYLKGHGYVGIGRITASAKPLRDVKINNKPLLSLSLNSQKMARNIESDELCEYVALVDWIKTVGQYQAKSVSGKRLFTTTHVRASLDGQPKTKAFLESAFGVDFAILAR
ncbi:GIY-YIG nuclease family protein [Bradyrhizobium guangzhouense]|uniref:GIY-YIG nuclease family protein n=1 Tax=Bradyrhizobium guangzhouense TaxID=1325095 RepID=UPI0010098A6F|nr:GIY-YIG nuclease family protein [Bradyrhizobium guangzhouense]RXH14856.1 GIY-YIG nuclease family protein [Bradyrhizobium guangzhouense]